MRKPSTLRIATLVVASCDVGEDEFDAVYPIRILERCGYTPAEARRIARWLIKAAEWAEGRKKK